MHSHVRLLVVGDSDDATEETAQLLAALRSDPRVHLHGADWDTPPLYSVMDLLVLPTYREGFPNVLLEAASMGVPVVATAVAGCVDAVAHERTGLIVPAHDAVALAAAMNRYVADASIRRAHGEAARARVLARFDQRVIWTGLRELYVTGDLRTKTLQSDTGFARRAA